MASKIASELKAKSDAATRKLTRQLQGIEAYMERSDAPGQWTTREVLSHVLSEPGRDPVALMKTFSERNFPTVEIVPGKVSVTEDRRKMTLKQFVDAFERQRQSILAYLDGLSDAELTQRKARVPLFKKPMGTDETPLQVYAGALLEFHFNQHADQLAKIRKAVGLPEVN